MENFISIRLSLKVYAQSCAIAKAISADLARCNGSMRSDNIWVQPAMYRIPTGSVKPRSFDGALNQTKKPLLGGGGGEGRTLAAIHRRDTD